MAIDSKVQKLFHAIKLGNMWLKIITIGVIVLGVLGTVLTPMLKLLFPNQANWLYISESFLLVSIVSTYLIGIYIDANKKEFRERERIKLIEKRAHDYPKNVSNAWELARVKLENYIDRNLNQVKAIFYLCVFVMLIGFGLIVYGIVLLNNSRENKDTHNTAYLSAFSGIIVNFIGSTFLFIYKSTMSQAKEYVEVLERINAVGMSIQIISNIKEENSQLKDEATVEIAKDVLNIYGKNSQKARKTPPR